MGLILVVALVVVLLLVCGGVTLVLVARRRMAPSQTFGALAQPTQSFASLGLDATSAWQAAKPSLAAVGMRPLDAETYVRGIGGGHDLFLTFQVGNQSLRAWLERPCAGCVLEQYLGTQAEVGPGEGGRSELERLVASSVREVLGALPHGARLTVTAPELPGDSYKATLTTPFSAVEHPSIVTRVLLTLDEAAKARAVGGSHVPLPPAVMAWQATGPSLSALRMTKLDAETYTRDLHGGQTLFLTLSVRQASLRGWLDRPCPGGALEQYLGARAEVSPGRSGRSEIDRFVASSVKEIMGGLPQSAILTVQAPEIPGDSYKASLTTPFTTPDQASTVARALLAFDDAATRRAVGGAPVHLPPVVMAWQAAAHGLRAVGMTQLDAETYTRELEGETLFLTLSVRDSSLRGWLDRRCPGGILERYLREQVELQPGDGGRTELAAWVARSVHEFLGSLPRGARLTLKAPEIPGDSYKASLTTPFASPEQAAMLARALLVLDEAVRRRMG